MYRYFQKNKIKVFPQVVLVILFSVFLPQVVLAATLSLTPPSGTYEVGETVTLRVVASSDVPLNAVSGSVLISPELFSIQSVSKNNSVLNFWITEPSFSQNSGVIKFEGVALNGFQGNGGGIVTISLKALKPGSNQIVIQNGQILANDGQGTDITNGLYGSSLKIIAGANKPLPPKDKTIIPVSIPEIPQPGPTLEAPEIFLGEKYGTQAIFGKSNYPNAQVLMTFIAADGGKVFITGVADAEGGFNLSLPTSLKRGAYSITAVMIKADKTNSERSNVINLKVGNILSDLSIEVKIAFVILILLIIYLIIRVASHFNESRKRSKEIKREVTEASKIAHKSFEILRSDIHDLEKRTMNVSERKTIKELGNDIDDAEGIIEKEIKDIE